MLYFGCFVLGVAVGAVATVAALFKLHRAIHKEDLGG